MGRKVWKEKDWSVDVAKEGSVGKSGSYRGVGDGSGGGTDRSTALFTFSVRNQETKI